MPRDERDIQDYHDFRVGFVNKQFKVIFVMSLTAFIVQIIFLFTLTGAEREASIFQMIGFGTNLAAMTALIIAQYRFQYAIAYFSPFVSLVIIATRMTQIYLLRNEP